MRKLHNVTFANVKNEGKGKKITYFSRGGSNDKEIDGLSEGTRTNSSSAHDLNSFEPLLIHLFKLNSEGSKAQLDIIPED